MSVNTYAVVVGGTVTNTVLWDGMSLWKPNAGTVVAVPEGIGVGSGWKYADGEWTAPDLPVRNFTWEDVRATRDLFLQRSDWTQVADAPVDSAAWAAYRQALRDVPQDYATPDEVVWPIPPA